MTTPAKQKRWENREKTMGNMINTRTFIEGCLDESQTKAFGKMIERLNPDYKAWAETQHQILEGTNVWPAVLEETLHRESIPEGLVCEFGVCTGSSTNLMARNLSAREIYGFDSFEGFPTDWIIGDVRVPKEMLAIDQSKLNFEPNVRLVKGFFDQSLPQFMKGRDDKVALMHIDCDTYDSTKDILSNTRNRLQVGSIIVFDEILGDMGLENEMLALWDQLILKGFEIEWISRGGHCWTAETQAFFKTIKKANPLYTLKLAFYNPRSVISHLKNKKKVEEALSAAAVRITKLPAARSV